MFLPIIISFLLAFTFYSSVSSHTASLVRIYAIEDLYSKNIQMSRRNIFIGVL